MVLNVGSFLVGFYNNDIMDAAQDLEWIKNSLNVIINLFRRYGLIANTAKSWTMTCQPGSVRPGMSEEAIGWQCTGLGVSYYKPLQRRIPCS